MQASGKRVLREAILAARAALTEAARARADDALLAGARRLIDGAGRVAAYVPPHGLLLPVLRPDRDLDWVAHDGSLATGGTLRRLREPTGPRLGPAALETAEIVFVPALAVDATGARLGRGGGSYDRALARVRPGMPVVALLYSGEVVPAVPVEPHDRPVTAALTPEGLVEFS